MLFGSAIGEGEGECEGEGGCSELVSGSGFRSEDFGFDPDAGFLDLVDGALPDSRSSLSEPMILFHRSSWSWSAIRSLDSMQQQRARERTPTEATAMIMIVVLSMTL